MKKYISKSLIIAFLVVMVLALSVPVAFASGGVHHRVRYGETLYSIGRLYNVHPYAIAESNHLYNPHKIYAGQVLYVPSGPPYPGHCYSDCGWGYHDYGHHPGGVMVHRVAYGESLSSIARQYGVSGWAIAQLNGLRNPHRIYAGQLLRIPAPYYHY